MPGVYRVCVKGHLPLAWAREFGDMELRCEPDGCTSLTGVVQDQSALFGLLARIRDLGLTLISIRPVETDKGELP